jgi:rod shape-determining protein MreC
LCRNPRGNNADAYSPFVKLSDRIAHRAPIIRGSKTIRSIFTRESQSGLRTIGLIIIAIILMIVDKRMDSFTTIRSALVTPLTPIHYLVSWPSRAFYQVKYFISTQKQLLIENKQLKAEQLQLQLKLQYLAALRRENNDLRELLKTSLEVPGKSLVADLLSIDPEPYNKQVIINKGSRDGVYIGQPVFDAFGVMGQVMQITPVSSRVLLINDPHSGVGVQSSRNGVRAIVAGDSYTGKIKLLYVPKTADIQPGDVFMTSGLGDHYPQGYPVGIVKTVSQDPGQPFSIIYLEPKAHLDTSRQVLLIWYQQNA